MQKGFCEAALKHCLPDMKTGNLDIIGVGLPNIRPPHHFVAEGVEEEVVGTLYDLDTVVGFGDAESGTLFAGDAAAIYGYEEAMAATLDV